MYHSINREQSIPSIAKKTKKMPMQEQSLKIIPHSTEETESRGRIRKK
jgi:hypothetical protein